MTAAVVPTPGLRNVVEISNRIGLCLSDFGPAFGMEQADVGI